MNWVQVRDRYPESNKLVLVAWADQTYMITYQVDGKFKDEHFNGWSYDIEDFEEQPDYWMELPEIK